MPRTAATFTQADVDETGTPYLWTLDGTRRAWVIMNTGGLYRAVVKSDDLERFILNEVYGTRAAAEAAVLGAIR